jgi:hypothetical protein
MIIFAAFFAVKIFLARRTELWFAEAENYPVFAAKPYSPQRA